MARHDQQAVDALWICVSCKKNKCASCVDVLRAVYADTAICRCTRRNHDGDALNEQILDPETGSVHGPGLTVTEDGEVIRAEQVKP